MRVPLASIGLLQGLNEQQMKALGARPVLFSVSHHCPLGANCYAKQSVLMSITEKPERKLF